MISQHTKNYSSGWFHMKALSLKLYVCNPTVFISLYGSTLWSVQQNSISLAHTMSISAQGKANRSGESFTFAEFKAMLSQSYRELPKGHDQYMHFADFLSYLFVIFTFLLAALRSIQFTRVHEAGVAAQKRVMGQRDKEGYWRPMVIVKYRKAKPRNASGPTALDSFAYCTVICTCTGEHSPLFVRYKTDGSPKSVDGNVYCWFNLFWHVQMGQEHNRPLMRVWNVRKRSFGKTVWGDGRITKAISKWCEYCEIPRDGACNTWCRKTYRTVKGN